MEKVVLSFYVKWVKSRSGSQNNKNKPIPVLMNPIVSMHRCYLFVGFPMIINIIMKFLLTSFIGYETISASHIIKILALDLKAWEYEWTDAQ